MSDLVKRLRKPKAYGKYEDEANEAADRIEQLQSLLSEAVDLMEGVRTGDYKPDSFTTQPWRAALPPPKEET